MERAVYLKGFLTGQAVELEKFVHYYQRKMNLLEKLSAIRERDTFLALPDDNHMSPNWKEKRIAEIQYYYSPCLHTGLGKMCEFLFLYWSKSCVVKHRIRGIWLSVPFDNIREVHPASLAEESHQRSVRTRGNLLSNKHLDAVSERTVQR